MTRGLSAPTAGMQRSAKIVIEVRFGGAARPHRGRLRLSWLGPIL
jgi:hypothetical protein